jgi:hypothetical protein
MARGGGVLGLVYDATVESLGSVGMQAACTKKCRSDPLIGLSIASVLTSVTRTTFLQMRQHDSRAESSMTVTATPHHHTAIHHSCHFPSFECHSLLAYFCCSVTHADCDQQWGLPGVRDLCALLSLGCVWE